MRVKMRIETVQTFAIEPYDLSCTRQSVEANGDAPVFADVCYGFATCDTHAPFNKVASINGGHIPEPDRSSYHTKQRIIRKGYTQVE